MNNPVGKRITIGGIIFLLLIIGIFIDILRPIFHLNSRWAVLPFLAMLVFALLCLFKPLKAIKMSEGPRWSLGRKLDLDANPPSKRATILLRIFGVMLSFFLLKTLVGIFFA